MMFSIFLIWWCVTNPASNSIFSKNLEYVRSLGFFGIAAYIIKNDIFQQFGRN